MDCASRYMYVITEQYGLRLRPTACGSDGWIAALRERVLGSSETETERRKSKARSDCLLRLETSDDY